MNTYTFNEIIEGSTCADFQVSITKEMLEHFKTISGDSNPMHTDSHYAREKGMKDRISYGMLTASFYSTLVGMYLPGKFCVLQEIKSTFNNPVYIGDLLRISGVVVKKNELFMRMEISAKIVNHQGIKVSKAKIVVGCLE